MLKKMDDYSKVMPYTDRMDYVSAMNQEHGYVVALERMLELEVPERVEHIRVIVAEMQRIASHLLGIGAFGLDLGAFTPFLYLFTEREKILDIFEKVSGARLLYNYMAVGGLMRRRTPGFQNDVAEFVKHSVLKLKS
jgi:NADH-quinone oxidoreductase subunit D